MLSIDTETTGKDLRHGAQAFLITTCDESGDNEFWEFDVDPLTRRVIYEGDGKTKTDIPKVWLAQFRRKLRRAIAKGEWIVGQNISFDVLALSNTPGWDIDWPWHLTHDTLIAGHLLASNHPHDLTSMTLEHLGRNIQPYEDRAEEACKKARNLCRSQRPDWRIAKDGLPEMPSAKGKVWKYDLWLPRTVCLYAPELLPDESESDKASWYDLIDGHSWEFITQDYANVDSLVTLELFKRQKELLEQRGLWCIYEERRKLMQVIHEMEERGITVSGKRLNALRETYKQEAATAEKRCISLSGGKLEKLPKSGSSNALRDTLFSDLRLPVVATSKKTGQPSVNKDVLEHWLGTLPERSKSYLFVRNLSDYRKRMTAISYMDGYERYWKPYRTGGTRFMDWFVLHPSVNETGTDTLRKSSSNPNEQNISKQKGFNLRYAFGPAPGREWWSLDYENLELRIPAYESGEEEMIQLFERPNDPPYFGSNHLLIFALLHPDKYDHNVPEGLLKAKDKFKSTWYQYTKNGNFANQYGAIEKSGTADRAYRVKGAQRRIKDRFPKITALNERQIAYAQKHGYVETMPDKEIDPRRGYPLLCPKDERGRVIPTVPLNYHVQGTAGWVIMRAEIEAYEYLQRFNNGLPKPEYFLIIDVHDEMVLDLPHKANKANLPIVDGVRKIMERMGDCIGVPLTVGVEYHPDNWSEDEAVR